MKQSSSILSDLLQESICQDVKFDFELLSRVFECVNHLGSQIKVTPGGITDGTRTSFFYRNQRRGLCKREQIVCIDAQFEQDQILQVG